MVLYMYSLTLYLRCLSIKTKENLVLSSKMVCFLYIIQKNKETLGRELDHVFLSNLLYYHLATSI